MKPRNGSTFAIVYSHPGNSSSGTRAPDKRLTTEVVSTCTPRPETVTRIYTDRSVVRAAESTTVATIDTANASAEAGPAGGARPRKA